MQDLFHLFHSFFQELETATLTKQHLLQAIDNSMIDRIALVDLCYMFSILIEEKTPQMQIFHVSEHILHRGLASLSRHRIQVSETRR
jgi:hypothetical protein